MLKKTKLFVGIALLVEAVIALATFVSLVAKKKSIAAAFLAMSAVGGAVGAYLICKSKYECCECDCEDEGEESDAEVEDVELDESELFARDEA